MATLLLLTNAMTPSAEVPARPRAARPHRARGAARGVGAAELPAARRRARRRRRDLAGARSVTRLLRTTGVTRPLFVVLTEGGLAALTSEWGVDDVLLDSAGPAEVEARCAWPSAASRTPRPPPTRRRARGELTIDEGTYTCRLRGRVLDLTFKEFELLKHLAQHPGRVYTRAQLLQEVWGYDYFGGTRTVDVHVRRLRAKLGTEHEQLIGTVRHVGYKFVTPPIAALAEDAEQDTAPLLRG
jgi:DNA-binding response OmpR family regulator